MGGSAVRGAAGRGATRRVLTSAKTAALADAA